MNNKADFILTKNIIFLGSNNEESRKFIDQAQSVFQKKWPSSSIFKLSEHIRNSERYLKSVRKEFPITSPLDNTSKYQMSEDQLNDSHLDWFSDYKAVLIVLPEFDKIYQNESYYFYELIRAYLMAQKSTSCFCRFLMTLSKVDSISIKKIIEVVGGDEKSLEKELKIIIDSI